MRIALTEDRISAERATRATEHRVLWDTTYRGLGVRLRGEGSATYVVRGRHQGKPVWLSIGPVDGLQLAPPEPEDVQH